MEYTDARFETLKNRYLKFLLFTRQSFLDKSRNIEKTHEMYGYGDFINSYNYEDLDEFSQRVSVSFALGYDMVMPIMDIMNQLINEVRPVYLSELSQRPSNKTIIVRKRLFGLPLPIAKYYETHDYKGELIERFTIKRIFSIKGIKDFLKDLKQEKSDEEISKEEMAFRLFHVFNIKETLYRKPHAMKCSIISPEETDRKKWFKTMVKFKAREQYANQVYAAKLEPVKQELVKQNREKRKSPSVKLVKWVDIDDKKNKNNFTKLIYALHKAGYLQGEVTKMVDNLAPVFDLEMGDWQSNFSKGCTGQSIGYDHGVFFEKLKHSYAEIVTERIEKQKLNEKTKIKLLKTPDFDNSTNL